MYDQPRTWNINLFLTITDLNSVQFYFLAAALQKQKKYVNPSFINLPLNFIWTSSNNRQTQWAKWSPVNEWVWRHCFNLPKMFTSEEASSDVNQEVCEDIWSDFHQSTGRQPVQKERQFSSAAALPQSGREEEPTRNILMFEDITGNATVEDWTKSELLRKNTQH